jgi:hypothetical protein
MKSWIVVRCALRALAAAQAAASMKKCSESAGSDDIYHYNGLNGKSQHFTKMSALGFED